MTKNRHTGSQSSRNPLPKLSRQTWPLYLSTGLRTFKSLAYYLVGFIIIAGTFGVGLLGGYFAAIIDKTEVPTKAAMTRTLSNVETSTRLYYAHNVEIGPVKSDLIRDTVTLDAVSPWLQKAIVSTEDEDFWTNSGVMPKALVRAVLTELTGVGGQTGGSTLTQQVVKLQFLNSQTTFKRKATEIMMALRLNKYYTKQQLLEEYLNIITLGRNNRGQNIAGVQTAARGLFGKNVKDINLAESAFIAGLPQSPSAYTPYTNTGAFKTDLSAGLNRQKTVLFRMYRAGTITKAQYDTAKAFDLKKAFLKPGSATVQTGSSSYVYNMVESEAKAILADKLAAADGHTKADLTRNSALKAMYMKTAGEQLTTRGYQVHATINKQVYDAMQNVVDQHKGGFGATYTSYVKNTTTGGYSAVKQPVQNGTVLLDNQTGAILGFVGGTAGEVNHIYTKRSPGSSIKPTAVYGPAIENKMIGSKTMLADFKTNFSGYSVTDYGGVILNKFVDATTALKNSYNIPAVNLYDHVMKQVNVKSYMQKMGVTSLTDDDYQNLGLALGGAKYGETVQEAAGAFATFARGGTNVTPYVIEKIVDPTGKIVYQHKETPRKVFSKATSYIMAQMLHQTILSGTGITAGSSVAFNSGNLIAKTGTSNDYKDLWFIGSTPGITMASWMGYDNDNGANHVMSSNGSAINQQYWAALANAVYRLIPQQFEVNKTMSRPSGVRTTAVNSKTGERNGTVHLGDSTITLTGDTTANLSYNYTPGVTQAQFGIGGTAANYADFWANFTNPQKAVKPKPDESSSTSSSSVASSTSEATASSEAASSTAAPAQ
ncbi:transglycosylase domain-containing protein [Lacticaseibacillus jixianensis]|uniref:Transglycosylase domain-containing protein n=1 Tax=Lacticaseibacillus jixianensis TaxID=2486012 RepID=A0ABW4B8E9_9LACO|nr:transglycosylase domain-containing protein [Lacticaseibacillus jixianensis]